MLYLIMGKSNSGKTTLFNKLLQDAEFMSKIKVVPSHTTRPIRPHEIDGREYVFDTMQQFSDYYRNGDLAEYSKFDTVFGTWFYYTLKKDILDCDMIKIIEPIGLAQIKQLGTPVKVFYINADYDTRFQRGIARGDDENELTRRLQADEDSFRYLQADYIVSNEDGTNIDDRVKLIKDIILKGDK